MIESIAEDAWGLAPSLQEQAEELWACIWADESDGVVGSTFVPPERRQALRSAAELAGCWWTWTYAGDSMWIPLKFARSRFSRLTSASMDDTTALSTLESMRDTSSGDERRALEWAIAKISAGR